VIEILLRFLAYGKEFFKDGWNWFDVIIVGISFAPTTDSLSVLRTLRVLRVLRLLSMIPAMRRVIEGLFEAIPGLLSVIAILMIINYVFAVIMTMQYGEAFPVMFGTLGKSLYTLFQVMTLEAWSSEVARPVMEQFPQAWFMFLLYILLTSFTILNLVIGVVVNAMQSKSLEEEIMHHDDVKEEVRALRREIRTLKKAVEK
jgi:voltage-gated sodium channel